MIRINIKITLKLYFINLIQNDTRKEPTNPKTNMENGSFGNVGNQLVIHIENATLKNLPFGNEKLRGDAEKWRNLPPATKKALQEYEKIGYSIIPNW